MYDYFIVGQGIAGSMLAWHLIKAGKRVLVIDSNGNANASRAASGIINPITGRRFVKSWMIDEILPYAIGLYENMQQELGTDFFKQMDILHVLNNNEELNDWSAKANTPDYENYLNSTNIHTIDSARVKNPMGCFAVNGGCKVDTEVFLDAIKQWLIAKNMFLEGKVEETDVVFSETGVLYKNLEAQNIIYAHGHIAESDAFFKGVPFKLAKGEGLLIEIEDFVTNSILHGDVMISPTRKKDVYYVGSTYQWDFTDALPSEEKRKDLTERIQKTINRDFKIVQHVSGIRPASKNRRPMMGMMPQQLRLGIFNGMGTKGFSLAPYFAQHFTSNLVNHTPLFPEVDVKCFF